MNQMACKIEKTDTILVAGGSGMIGRACIRTLNQKGYSKILVPTHETLDFCNSNAVQNYFSDNKIDIVIQAAGKVGGILENQKYPAAFLVTNLLINLNTALAAEQHKCKRVIFLGSSCMYPKHCPQPMRVDDLFTGKLEATSLAYATSKLTSVELGLAFNRQSNTNRFLCLIPNSVFGPGDNFDPESGHVLSSLICRFHRAKENKENTITLWGTGEPKREFIFSEDLADAILFLLEQGFTAPDTPINVGSGFELSIAALADLIKSEIEFKGKIRWDADKPNGSLRKLLDNSVLLNLGWSPKTDIKLGIKSSYEWYVKNRSRLAA
jgi:GDP-L-fucose synthase